MFAGGCCGGNVNVGCCGMKYAACGGGAIVVPISSTAKRPSRSATVLSADVALSAYLTMLSAKEESSVSSVALYAAP